MACCQEGFTGARKGIHTPARRAQRRASQTSDGQDRQGIHLRRRERQGDAGRSLRRTQSVDRLSFHVRSGLGGRLQELLLSSRPFRRRQLASAASRRHVRSRIASAAVRVRTIQKAHGLALQVGFVPRQRLQLRLSRVVHQRRRGEGQSLL